ncbi:helix-turn-helix transcriptional regulator [Entomobacter blattae]|nr:AlpA family phage regulatory protein [Entomobacter blattae]
MTTRPKAHKSESDKEKPGPLKISKELSSTRLLSIKELQEDMAISRFTIWRMIREGKFPPPVHLSGKTRRWPAHVYEEWKNSLKV